MATGTIKKLISDRGFGFIIADDGKDYFFHRDGLNASLEFDRLTGGAKVSFDVESSPRGRRATSLSAVETAENQRIGATSGRFFGPVCKPIVPKSRESV